MTERSSALVSAGLRLRALAYKCALPALLLALIAELAVFVRFAAVNRDEGWYLLAGRLAYEGKVPYRDFSYFQGPLLPYVYGFPQWLFGSGLMTGRITAAMFGCLSASLVAYLAYRLDGKAAAILALILVAVTPEFINASATARSEAAVAPLILLAALLLARPPKGFGGLAGPPMLMVIASTVRFAFLPAAIVAAVLAWWRTNPSPAQTRIAAVLCVLTIVALFAPFFALAPERMLFNVYTAQAARNDQYALFNAPIGARLLLRLDSADAVFSVFLVIWVPLLLMAAMIWRSYRFGWRPRRSAEQGDHLTDYAIVGVFALAVWLPYLVFEYQEVRYFTPPFAVLAAAGAAATTAAARGALGERMRLLPYVVYVLVVLALLFGVRRALAVIDVRHPQYDTVQDVAAYIDKRLAPDARFITFNTTLAVESGHDVPVGMEMGNFSYWPRLVAADAERFGVYDRDALVRAMLSPDISLITLEDYDLAIAVAGDLDVYARSPPQDPPVFRVFPELKDEYEIETVFPRAGQFNQQLYVLVRR